MKQNSGFDVLLQEEESATMHTLVRELGRRMRERHATLAVAESVTGGQMAAAITAVPGASDYFLGSAVCYHPRAKFLLAGVDPKTIHEHGAVSREVAREMASGIRSRLQADIGVGLTGVAGPGPGTGMNAGSEGTVFVAIDDGRNVQAQQVTLNGTREYIQGTAVIVAVRMILISLQKLEDKE